MFWLPLKKMNRYAYCIYPDRHYYMYPCPGIWCPRYHHYLGVNKASSLCFHSITIHQQTNHLVGHYKVHREPVQRVFWMIQVEEQHKQQHHLSARSESQAHILARQHVNLDSVWWVEKTDDNNRESHHRDDDATGGLHLTPKWYDLRLPEQL